MSTGSKPSATEQAIQRASAALAGNRPQEAQQIAGEILKRDPRHTRALHIMGGALLMQNRAKDAIAPLEAAARGRHDPEIDTELAMALRLAGRRDDALSRIKRTVKRRPTHAPALLELGFLLSLMSRHDEAIDALKQGITASPMLPELWNQLGYVLLACGRREEAKLAYARGLLISPDNPALILGIGRACAENEEYAEAAEHFRRCLRVQPGVPDTWMKLGHCLLQLGDTDTANDCFRNAIRGNPDKFGRALASMATSSRGRFFLKPSVAGQFFRGQKT